MKTNQWRFLTSVMACILNSAMALTLLCGGCATNTSQVLPPEVTSQLDTEASAALRDLYANSPAAKTYGHKAKAILVFPNVIKGGFMIGGQLGNGVLFQHGRPAGYYNTVAASYGFQAGLQRFGYALFLMNDKAMASLHVAGGWQLGVGPNIVIANQSMGKSYSATDMQGDIYAFIFDQTGLMAGAGLQGSKITEIQP